MPKGQTAHLEGKRTGRPLGTGQCSTVLQDMRWAFKTYMNPDSRPPTQTAKAFKVLAQQDLLAFVQVLGRLEAGLGEESKTASPNRPQAVPQDQDTAGRPGAREGISGQFKTLTIYAAEFLDFVRGERSKWIANLPPDAALIYLDVLPSGDIELTIQSRTFGFVQQGQPMPKFELKRVYNHG